MAMRARLSGCGSLYEHDSVSCSWESPAYLIDVTSHPRATADLQMREPRKPLPPATTSFFLAAPDAADMLDGLFRRSDRAPVALGAKGSSSGLISEIVWSSEW